MIQLNERYAIYVENIEASDYQEGVIEQLVEEAKKIDEVKTTLPPVPIL